MKNLTHEQTESYYLAKLGCKMPPKRKARDWKAKGVLAELFFDLVIAGLLMFALFACLYPSNIVLSKPAIPATMIQNVTTTNCAQNK